MHKVAILVLNDVVFFDLAIPLEIFSRARKPSGELCYEVKVCGPKKQIHSDSVSVGVRPGLRDLNTADTIVVPGSNSLSGALPTDVARALRRAIARGTRVISICSGAFHLAEAGLLDGRPATTHWLAAEELQLRYPEVRVDANVLYVDDGDIMTSAGACAGIDLCLHVVRKDFGASVAVHSARLAVAPLERSGGQAQFIEVNVTESESGSLLRTLKWIEKNLEQNPSVESIANQAGMCVRTLNRHFIKQTGLTPKKWLAHSRMKKARYLLETSQRSIEEVAELSGFGSAMTMREHFRRALQISPRSYRDSFKPNPLRYSEHP